MLKVRRKIKACIFCPFKGLYYSRFSFKNSQIALKNKLDLGGEKKYILFPSICVMGKTFFHY